MPEVRLTFLDGEVVPVDTELIDFGQPVIKAFSIQKGSNNEELTVPLSSVKYIVMEPGEGEGDADAGELGKVVIHFTDHEVLRVYAGRDTLGGPYGVIYTLIEPGRRSRRRIGVPFTAVKAIFKVKDWEGRGKASPARRASVGSKKARAKKPAPDKPGAKTTAATKKAALKKPAAARKAPPKKPAATKKPATRKPSAG
jgi:hypothetical protein